jgi:hypothetical protein
MVLGIIGGILGLPSAFCSGACASCFAVITSYTDELDNNISETVHVFLYLGLISSILGLISSFLYKQNQRRWGLMIIFAGILSGINVFLFNFLSLIVCILFLISGGIILSGDKNQNL